MSKNRIIELLLKVIKLVTNKDTELSIGQAMALMKIKTELKTLGIDLLEYL